MLLSDAFKYVQTKSRFFISKYKYHVTAMRMGNFVDSVILVKYMH